MTLQNPHTDFSSTFLNKHFEIVLREVFHRIKAFILFPPNCGCETLCRCEKHREQVVLSLNVSFLSEAEKKKRNPEFINALKALLKIPEDPYFREHWNHAYPLWLINQEFDKKEAQGHFKIIDRLVWTLLRLGKTHEDSFLAERQASLTEAIKMIVGDVPLKSGQVDTPRGEKAYGKCFKDYKTVCHIMAAFEFMRREGQERDVFSGLSTPPQIERFLQLSCWFREQLLSLQTPNIKNKSLFSQEVLVCLPPWVSSEGVALSIEPYPEKGNELKPLLINPSLKG